MLNSIKNWRDWRTSPQLVMTCMPFLLFFPVGMMYAGIIIFIFLWLATGNFKEKWATTRCSALFIPIAVMLGVVTINFLFFTIASNAQWSALIHYFVFLFVLLFLSLGHGTWQLKARKVFLFGAIYGSTVYYLAHLGMLPEWQVFKNYAVYTGNKSIVLSILLAIASAWLLNDTIRNSNKVAIWLGVAGYLYIAFAVLFLATSRTGMLLFFILSTVVLIPHFSLTLRGLCLVLSIPLIVSIAWHFSPTLRERSLITVESIAAFAKGQIGTGDGNRLQFIQKTGEMILERPLLGHGVGSWLIQYPTRARGLETAGMSTPHNDYLLYGAELGLVGLIALVAIFFVICRIAWQAGGAAGLPLMVIGVSLIVGCGLNAMLRDWKFALPMVILLRIALIDIKPTPRLSAETSH
jgi:O-antigen ligase